MAWIKDCFVCHKKGHHLSRSQFHQVKMNCRERLIHAQIDQGIKHPNVSESKVLEKTWQHIKDSKMLCNLCHGERFLFYPRN